MLQSIGSLSTMYKAAYLTYQCGQSYRREEIVETLKVHAAVEVPALVSLLLLLASYLKLRNLTLIGLMSFFPEIYDTNRIKVGCTCVHILCLP